MSTISAASLPTLEHERAWWGRALLVAGVDEAGRGALAGPVVAGAVILPAGCDLAGIWARVRDSKILAPGARFACAGEIQAAALAWAVGEASAAEIDEVGIVPATRRAMMRAVAALSPAPQALLIDWVRLPLINLPQESYARADATIVSVAAASILAKVHRDRFMRACAEEYSAYYFASNKGYGTAAHLSALATHGPCPLHRTTFAPLGVKRTLFDE